MSVKTWSTSNYLKVGSNPSNLDFPGNQSVFTLHCFYKPALTDATDQTLISKYDGSFGPLMRTISGKLRMFWIDSGVTGHEAIGATTMSTGTWYACGATWPKSTSPGMQVWLNGAVDGTDATNGTMKTTADTTKGWCVGVRPSGTNAMNTSGQIAEVAMWNFNLTAAEMLALAKGISPFRVRPRNLVGYWPIWTPSLLVDFTGGTKLTQVGTLGSADHAPVGPPVFARPVGVR